MCGRFTLTVETEDVIKAFDIEEVQYEIKPRYNIAPTQTIAGVLNDDGKRVLQGFHWGLLPFWAKSKKIAYSTFNARAESIQSKPAFRSAFPDKRMVILADGFYEWAHKGKEKQPCRFRVKSSDVFAFAGLYDTWKSPEGEHITSCTIITTTPNALTEKVHDRMPVILGEDELKIWLDPGVSDKDLLQGLLQPYDAEDMYTYPVSNSVGNVRNQGADLIEEIPLNSK
ncbi:SOS response-associated peptidase [Paenibacillus cineris]|uniref:Abasic site processing protein n=1 Tax=Paenibacillus cineris TaxID=237530 RepID=A0ABQ4LNJ1_9BACL|nr:SOS response-associated peptidase [Paenibacillus cineris]GIO57940.1 putative SOS response-associated peptidase YoqW [Paenibacillus cineris]